MTKRKELEAIVAEKDREIGRLRCRLDYYEAKFEEIQKAVDATPDDCKPGEYCKACAFSKVYVIRDFYGGNCLVPTYLCNKAGSCEKFVQKKTEEVEEQ